MRTPADIYQDAYLYIFIIFMGIPATILYNLVAGIIRSLGGQPDPGLFPGPLLLPEHLPGLRPDPLGPHGGGGSRRGYRSVPGHLRRGLPGLHGKKNIRSCGWTGRRRRLDLRFCGKLCGIGAPMGLQYSITAIGSIVLQAAVNSLGSTYVAQWRRGASSSSSWAAPSTPWGPPWPPTAARTWGPGSWTGWAKASGPASCWGRSALVVELGAMLLFSPPVRHALPGPGRAGE